MIDNCVWAPMAAEQRRPQQLCMSCSSRLSLPNGWSVNGLMGGRMVDGQLNG